jgi:uncharacterized protein YjdB
MRDRSLLGALLLIGLVVPFTGCSNPSGLDSIQVTPATQSLTVGQTAQFTATGTYGNAKHPSTKDITSGVTWTSGTPSVATISASGVATAVGAGTTTITASASAFNGPASSSATLTVAASGGGVAGGNIVSIAVIPGTQSVASPTETGQFFAIGTTSSGATENLTNQVTWNSSSTQIATIGATTGLATAVGQGTATITAIYNDVANGTVVTGTATFTVLGGTSEQVTALTIYPGTQAATSQAQQSQFFVLGAEGSNGLLFDVTSQVVWTSSNLAVATIGTTGNGTPGLATAVGAGSTTITATWTNADNSKVVATATYSVTIGAAQEPLLSINVVPSGTTVSNKGMTGQYLAFGTYSTTPTVRDLTNQVTWISLLPEVASIDSGGTPGEVGGLATAQGYTGNTVIYAETSNPDGTVVLSNSQTFTCKDPIANICIQTVAHPQFATVTVFNAGENSTTWQVTAPSDTGVADLIHCGPGWSLNGGLGGSVCTGTYETGSTVVLTESAPANSFGGWSTGDGVAGVGCQEANLLTSPTCTVTLTGNTSIGAIFY